jgi:hypothetical protein
MTHPFDTVGKRLSQLTSEFGANVAKREIRVLPPSFQQDEHLDGRN